MPKKNIEDIYELSPMQKGMLFHFLFEPESEAYFEQISCTIAGPLDVKKFKAAWEKVISDHPVFRTSFHWENLEKPLQVVHREVEIPWQYINWSEAALEEQDEKLEAFLTADRSKGFSLQDAPVMHFTLIQLSPLNHRFIWSHHHILIDGWSIAFVFREVSKYYRGTESGSDRKIQSSYRNYISWLQSRDEQKANDYWRHQLKGFITPVKLSAARKPETNTPEFSELKVALDQEVTDKLAARAKAVEVTLSTLFQGAWAVLLSRYSGLSDVIFGITMAVRPPEVQGIESMVGLFINTLPLRVMVKDDLPLGGWLGQLQSQFVELEGYAYAPLTNIQQLSEVEKGSPLFETLLVFENYPVEKEQITGELILKDLRHFEATNYPLTVVIAPGEQLSIQIKYHKNYFDHPMIESLGGHFKNLLVGISASSAQDTVSALTLLSAAERRQLLVEWNETSKEFPTSLCVHRLFEQQAALRPHAPALDFEGHLLSYAQLNGQANQLARHLLHLGLRPEGVVGICLERSAELVVAILAVLKAGGAYLPLDPALPHARLAYMIEDAALSLVLTHQQYGHKLPQALRQIDLASPDWRGHSDENLSVAPPLESLAYVIYTSGSTGQPKGVMSEHRGLLNRLLWMQDAFRLTPDDCVLQKTPFSFDVSVWEFLWPLMVGARLVVARPDGHKDPHYLLEVIEQQGVTTIHFVPSMLEQFVGAVPVGGCARLRRVICSGEALSKPLQERYFEKLGCELYNLYGPTEASIDVTWWKCQREWEEEYVPIGRPISNMQVYILDGRGEPVAAGVAGELYLGGVGLARGYVKQAGLTAERFVSSPFVEGERLYRTGDVGRYTSEGVIEYLGRTDHQVKVRGQRIELGEIEVALEKQAEVNGAIVIVKDVDSSNQQLVAYYRTANKEDLSSDELRAFLSERLPDYMVPNIFIHLKEFPLTSNGKVDRKNLQELYLPERQTVKQYAPPRNPNEEILKEIWQEVLKLEQVGIYDDFFDLGGHSLLAIQIIVRIKQRMSKELPIRSLFENPSIARLSHYIEQLDGLHPKTKIEPISRNAVSSVGGSTDPAYLFPLSFTQKPLWLLENIKNAGATYNITGALRIKGDLSLPVFEKAVDSIFQRHEMLRTSFDVVGEQPVQKVADHVRFTFDYLDLSHLNDVEEQVKILYLRESQKVFDLKKWPLVRLVLVKCKSEEYVAVLSLHHVIADGWSMGVMAQDFVQYYLLHSGNDSMELAPLSVQYGDYTIWQQDYLKGELLQKKIQHWKDHLKGAPSLLRLCTDYPRPKLQSFAGSVEAFILDEELTTKLKTFARKRGATLFMTLLSAWQVLLARYSHNEKEIVIGTPVANRNHEEIEPLIGLFVNTLPLKTSLAGEPDFHEVLERTKSATLEAYEHQDVPFEALVEVLRPAMDTSYSSLFQVLFVLQTTPVLQLERMHLPGFEFAPLPSVINNTAKFDLNLGMIEVDGVLHGGLEYNTSLFAPETIHGAIKAYKNLLAVLPEKPGANIFSLPLMSHAEIEQTQGAWNRTEKNFSRNKTVHRLFEEQVARTPDAIALEGGGEKLTYQQLNSRANQLANYLNKAGLKQNQIIGILAERSVEAIVTILAVLKSGAAYLPLDPAYPKQRLSLILEHARLETVILQSHLDQLLPPSFTNKVFIDRDREIIAEESECNLTSSGNPSDLAYVIYTSGSTGKPKGVMIRHQSLVNYAEASILNFSLTSEDRVLQFASLSFDTSAEEIFPCLCSGATLVLRNDRMLASTGVFLEECDHLGITLLDLPTSFWHHLVADLEDEHVKHFNKIKTVIIGGEAVNYSYWSKWGNYFEDSPALWNTYGPTEATIVATLINLSEIEIDRRRSNIPIGKPVQNVKVYVLDEFMQAVPQGMPGEIYIGGAGVAAGYLNDPALTEQAFVPDPFCHEGDQKLYRTGDKAKFLPDGSIEFLGRTDEQVKVRGFRVELKEIEDTLIRHTSIKQCLVVCRNDEAGTHARLVAYYVPKQMGDPALGNLRDYLRDSLPSYMIPDHLIALDEMPINPNGKIDLELLKATRLTPDTSRAYVAPTTDLEKAFAQVWEETIGIEKVGLNDNFFELGGHSLHLFRIIHKLNKITGTNISITGFINHPTIAKLLLHLETAEAGWPIYDEYIDLEKEAVLDESVTANGLVIETDFRNVFLTGCTGFVGSYLLKELLDKQDGKIYCLIRAASIDEARARIRRSMDDYALAPYDESRIVPVLGDLTLHNFGLSLARYDELCTSIDAIIHNGASTNLFYNYAALKTINVDGTKEILNFACRKKLKTVNHVSTISVFASREFELNEYSDSSTQLHTYEQGYNASKWVAENMVMQARDRGVPCNIYRLGRVMGHSETGIVKSNDYIYSALLSALLINQLPKEFGSSEVDIVPVDYVAKAIVQLSSSNHGGGRIYHLCNPKGIEIDDLVLYLEQYLEKKIERVHLNEWVENIKALSTTTREDNVAVFARSLYLLPREKQDTDIFHVTHTGAFKPITCDITVTELAKHGIKCPEPDGALMATYCSFIKRSLSEINAEETS